MELHRSKTPFNVEMILDEANQTDSKRVKRSLILQSYQHQYSFYGQVEDENGEKQYKRVEIFSNTLLGSDLLSDIKEQMEEELPDPEYSIWAFNYEKRGIQLVKGYGSHVY